jgi:monoamine oxidase
METPQNSFEKKTSSFTTSIPMDMQVYDAVVVGAGAAGLTAAYDLFYEQGVRVKIVEASNRIGGRLKKAPSSFANFPIDLGGEWIHVHPRVLNEITWDNPYRGTTYLYKPTQYVEWNGKGWTREALTATDYRFKNGTWFDFFNDYIAADLLENNVIEFNCQVGRVDYTSSPATVTCTNGKTFQAKHVVVTVPIPVLKKGSIVFNPPLPAATQTAINDSRYYQGLKVFFRFTTRFYRDAFAVANDFKNMNHDTGDRYFWDEARLQPTTQNVLGFFCVGTLADRYMGLTDQQIIDKLLAELDVMFAGRAKRSFLSAVVQNWSAEPFAGGAYSNFKNYGHLERLRIPVGSSSQIIFAGEGVPYRDYEHGFAHGAAFSGRAVAEYIVALKNGQNPGQIGE